MGIVSTISRIVGNWLKKDRAPYPLSDEEWQDAQALDQQQQLLANPPAPALGLAPMLSGWAVLAPTSKEVAKQKEKKALQE